MQKVLTSIKSINEGDIARTCSDNPKLIPQRIHQERMRVVKGTLRTLRNEVEVELDNDRQPSPV